MHKDHIDKDPKFILAKELFLKSYKTQLFLNDETVKQYEADMNNAIAVATMFMETYELQTRNSRE